VLDRRRLDLTLERYGRNGRWSFGFERDRRKTIGGRRKTVCGEEGLVIYVALVFHELFVRANTFLDAFRRSESLVEPRVRLKLLLGG
jgi:hypothetical protein